MTNATNEQLNMNIANSSLKPIFADGTAIVMRVKTFKNPQSGEIEKDGYIEIVFLDMMKRQPVGEFVIGKNTAKELIDGIAQNITNLEKELKSKDMPKSPEITPSGNTSYR
ncbi:MAG: hypothetical protein KGI06_02145 [Candidatus Micrarchaeota archaeon]|nr:hypothetical protein [Candidatus Micrarchaeota archaeon]